jgi:hypothetical protein
MTTRRALLAGMAALTLPRAGWADAVAPAWLACAREGDGSFALYGLREDGTLAFRQPLPARGHAGARHPVLPLAVVMARRPGDWALVLDCASGAVMARLTPPEGGQFNGHAAFVQGGAVLATSEQRGNTSAGQVGLYDTATWARMGAWDTGGLGPHEVLALPGDRLAVANGGIATDPTDRRKLNLNTMRPSLVVLDAGGRLEDALDLPDLRQNSIRHLALAGQTLAFAMQWEGDPARVVPLLGLWRPGAAPVLAEAPDTALMQGYAGSVAVSGGGGQVAITSPRGGRMQVFDAAGRWQATIPRADICGLATAPGGFVASDGTGALLHIGATTPRLLSRLPLSWDNHVVVV